MNRFNRSGMFNTRAVKYILSDFGHRGGESQVAKVNTCVSANKLTDIFSLQFFFQVRNQHICMALLCCVFVAHRNGQGKGKQLLSARAKKSNKTSSNAFSK
ncbi:MAG: hypothetical protein Q4A04_03650 [Eubacteriales bacterium]|nr:hypothetical protein [Eubacteriales bacterium]